MMIRDRERRLAIVALLALPEPPEMIGLRGHRITQRRRAFTEVDAIKRDLATAYAAYRCQTYADISRVVWIRKQGMSRIARRA